LLDIVEEFEFMQPAMMATAKTARDETSTERRIGNSFTYPSDGFEIRADSAEPFSRVPTCSTLPLQNWISDKCEDFLPRTQPQ
jgi:hypothetical protein